MIGQHRSDRRGVSGEIPVARDGSGSRAAWDAVPAVVAVLVVAVLLIGAYFIAPRHGLDTWGYIRVGKKILRWIFHGSAMGSAFPHDSMIPNYIISSVLIAASYIIFGDHGTQYFIYFNIVLFGLMVFALFRLWRDVLTPDARAPIVVVGGLYIIFGLVDVPLWSYYDLSDMLFMVWVAAFVYLVVVGQARGVSLSWLAALVLAVVGYFVRPTGILLPVLWLLALGLATLGQFRTRAIDLVAFVVCAVMTLVALAGVPWLIAELISGNMSLGGILPHALSKSVGQAVVFYREGWVVADRANTYIADPHGYLDFLRITVSRFIYYFIPLREGYSTVHNALNGVYLVVFVAGIIKGFQVLRQRGRNETVLAWTLTMFSLCYGLLHAVTLVSYDWRYQLPAMVPAWLLAGVGITAFWRRLTTVVLRPS